MIIKWKTGGFNALIARVECTRETDASIFLMSGTRERREAKRSAYYVYHDSWVEARDYLLEKEKSKEIAARSKADKALEQIQFLESMAEPK